MSEQNKLLADSLRKIAELLENNIKSEQRPTSSGLSSDLESRLDDVVSLIQQLTLKIDGIISTISNVQSQVMSLRSTLRTLENTKTVSKAEQTKSDSTTTDKPGVTSPDIPKDKPKYEETPDLDTGETDSESVQKVSSSTAEIKPPEISSAEMEEIQKKLGSIERNITDLQFQHQSGFVEDDEYKKELDKLKKEREELLTRIK